MLAAIGCIEIKHNVINFQENFLPSSLFLLYDVQSSIIFRRCHGLLCRVFGMLNFYDLYLWLYFSQNVVCFSLSSSKGCLILTLCTFSFPLLVWLCILLQYTHTRETKTHLWGSCIMSQIKHLIPWEDDYY